MSDAPDGLLSSALPPLPWTEDDTLRDEGVAFGIAATRPGVDAKRTHIRSTFEARRHAVARHREALQTRLDELVAQRVDTKSKIDSLQEDLAEATTPSKAPSLGRTLAGIVLVAAACILNDRVLVALLTPVLDAVEPIAAALLLTGLFGSTLLYPFHHRTNDSPETHSSHTWWRRCITASPSLATAAFVVVWSLPTLSPVLAGTVFIYLMVFFLVGGHSTVRLLARVEQAVRHRSVQRQRDQQAAEARKQIQQLHTETLPDIDREARHVQHELLTLPDAEALNAEETAALALFDSEVALARAANDGMNRSASALEAVLQPSRTPDEA